MDNARPSAFNLRRYSIPLLLAGVTLVAYGLLLPLTGFYWDDWPFAWLANFRGPAIFIPAFSGFRPFLGPIFLLTTWLVPANPLLWQIFALVIRWLSGLAAGDALSQVWPTHKRQVLVASLLFVVFPGYSQHWVALTHINQEWIPLIFYLLSFAFTARALRLPHGPLRFSLIALAFLVLGLFPTEYFLGLEPLRFLFIFVIVSESVQGFRNRLLNTLRHWWPYLLIWLADAAWLVYYYKSGAYISYDVTAVRSTPRLSEAVGIFADALWKAGAYAWAQVLVLCARAITAPTNLLTLALIAAAFLLASFLLLRTRLPEGAARPFAIQAVLIGLAGILLGRVPSFAAGLPLTLQSSFDRLMISMMLGASLLATGLVELLLRNARLKTLACALLIALGMGQQFFNANIFRRDWARQREIYWQMAWRMPALKPDTALITQQMPLDYETDFSMTAAVNWIYAPLARGGLHYALIYSEKRLGGVVLPSLQPGTPIRFPFRTEEFNGNTSQSVAIYVPPNGCLRVLDPALGDAELYSRFPDSLTGPVALSDPSRILIDAPALHLPASPFGTEPAHDWCYFYEIAELKRQAKDWDGIVKLAIEAAGLHLAPEDAFEWLPFIEGYARAGNLHAAQDITHKAWNDDPKLHRGLCGLWKRLESDGTPETSAAAASIIGQFGCGQ